MWHIIILQSVFLKEHMFEQALHSRKNLCESERTRISSGQTGIPCNSELISKAVSKFKKLKQRVARPGIPWVAMQANIPWTHNILECVFEETVTAV